MHQWSQSEDEPGWIWKVSFRKTWQYICKFHSSPVQFLLCGKCFGPTSLSSEFWRWSLLCVSSSPRSWTTEVDCNNKNTTTNNDNNDNNRCMRDEIYLFCDAFCHSRVTHVKSGVHRSQLYFEKRPVFNSFKKEGRKNKWMKSITPHYHLESVQRWTLHTSVTDESRFVGALPVNPLPVSCAADSTFLVAKLIIWKSLLPVSEWGLAPTRPALPGGSK